MSDHLETILEQTAALRAALAGDSPAGADLSLEPEFEQVKAELEKLSSLEGGDVDWRLVVDRAEDLLANRTKDLRLAVWLTAGGVERSGWRGFVRGLAVCRGLVADLWDPLLPARPKARTNIVLWLGERVAPKLEELSVSLADGDDVRAALTLVEDIDRLLADKLGDSFPGIRGLVSATKARVRDIPEPPPEPVAAPAAEAAASDWADDDDEPPPPPPPAGGVQLSTSAADADTTTRTCGEALVALARSLLLADLSRAWAYRLHRKGIWLPFEHVVVEGGVVPLPGPDAATVEQLRDLLASARWHELVVVGEEASARFPLWLDAQRFVAVALERMGTPFTSAREAVGREATDFARRSAFLLGARFEDGVPVASPETADWLEVEARRWQLGSRANDVGRDEDRDLAARFAEARDLVAAGRHAEGLAIAVQLARRGSDTRERFRSSLDVARLAMNAGAHEVARPILEGLVAIAAAHALETWDPSLCARLYAGLYRCLPADAPDRAKVFEVLCRLDPGAALRARGNGSNGPTTRVVTGAPSPVPVSSFAASAASGAPHPVVAPEASAASQTTSQTTSESEWADDD
ncbi:MAG: type VI secretion system protein TssA [Labilithrix sp.]|nr:type VI secretion system protein TssA [Labilithrix sp.]